MARIRTIKPEFPQSETIGHLSRDARLLFVQLWTICDDEGRARAASRLLASLLYPYDEDAAALIDVWLDELEAIGCITRYEHEGSRYLQVNNWLKHQKIDRPSPSKIPPFDEASRGLDESSRGLDADLGPRTSTKDHKAPNGATRFAFDGKVVRLKPDDFAAWAKSYDRLDLMAELQCRDDWLAEDPARRKNWFISTSNWLNRRNSQAPPRKRDRDLTAAIDDLMRAGTDK